MELSWFQSILYSLISGFAEILPVSAEAHRVLFFKICGMKDQDTVLLDMLIHIAVLGGLYFSNLTHLARFSRAKSLARIPKRRRRRPLDTRSLMDISMLNTMAVPVVLGLLLFSKVSGLKSNLMVLSAFLLLNSIILYVPQFFSGSNRDARTLSPLVSTVIGLGGGISVLPGISAVGATTSIASICGVERKYGLDMALMLDMVLMAGYIVYDIMLISEVGIGALAVTVLIRYLLCACVAFCAVVLAVKFLRRLAAGNGFAAFGIYSIGLALFTFILNLMA